MAQTDIALENLDYQTRELSWELQQPHPDQQRIRMFLEQDADLRLAMAAANLHATDLLKKPAFKPLQLQRYLKEEQLGA